MRTFKIYSFSNFKICSTVLTIVTMLYITSPRLPYFITGSLYLSAPFTHFIQSPPLATTRFFLFHWFLAVAETAKDLGRLYNRFWCISHCGFLLFWIPSPTPVFLLLGQCQTQPISPAGKLQLCAWVRGDTLWTGERPQLEALLPLNISPESSLFSRTNFPPVVPAFCCSSGPSNSCWGFALFCFCILFRFCHLPV